MIKCIIVDDEPLAQEVLETYIGQTQELQLVARCSNALEAFGALQSENIDLMFLDIRMPAVSGIDFLKALKAPPAVIFTTAFADYALTGFELEAVDYLLKPVTYPRFQKSIQKLLKIYPPELPQLNAFTYFKVSGRLVKVMHAHILYAQSVKDYIRLVTTQGSYLVHMTMKYLNGLLPADTFVRVHRSYLVNKQQLTVIDAHQLNIGNEVIPVGDNYKEAVQQMERTA